MADTFDAILIWRRHGAFAVMSPQTTSTNSLTLLKYTKLSGLCRCNVANGIGLVGRCMLGELHTAIFRHVSTVGPHEFLRLDEARDSSIRSLCFVKLSDGSVAELVNMDERYTHDMAPVLGQIALYVAAMEGGIAGSQLNLQRSQSASLVDLDSSHPLSASPASSSNTAWDLLCCGELPLGNALKPILSGTLCVQTDQPQAFFADGTGLCKFRFGAFLVPLGLESQRTVRLKHSAESARELIDNLKHFRELIDSPQDREPSRPEQQPRSAPATLGAQSLAAMMETLRGRGSKPMPRHAANPIVYQLARTIVHANGLGVCHRDVRPDNIMIQLPSLNTELTGWALRPSASSYSAPEVFVSPESVIMEHMTADVWSIGTVLFETLKGSPLIKTDSEGPVSGDRVLARLMRMLGSPSEAALKALDPTSQYHVAERIIQPQPLKRLLRGRPPDGECTHLLDRMLDWNPATREPAASLLCFPYFDPSRAESCKYKAATQCTATTAEIEAMVSLAFAAHARRLVVEREVETWMSPHPSLQNESQLHVATRSQERLRSNIPLLRLWQGGC
jgi:serine/threonine protein kinase